MYVNLHQHTHYSILDSISKISDYLDRIESIKKMPHVMALTDHGTMMGSVELLNTCKQRKFKPIIGMEIYMATDEEWSQFEEKQLPRLPRSHLILLAKNYEGYLSLVKLNNEAIRQGYVTKTRIGRQYVVPSIEFIKDIIVPETLICSTACMGGFINSPLHDENVKIGLTDKRLKQLYDIFNNDNLYIEFMLLTDEKQLKVNENLARMAGKYNLPTIFSCDAHYAFEQQSYMREYATAVNWKIPLWKFREIISEQRDYGEALQRELFIRTPKEIMEAYYEGGHHKIIPEEMMAKSIENTLLIADEIEEYSLDRPQSLMISKDYKEFENIDELFQNALMVGFKERVIKVIPKKLHTQYMERLEYEIGVITEKGFIEYFMLLHEITRRARKKDCLVGVGRGSAVGSLICYLLGISEIDPIKYNLMFERFLDLSRKDYPDIDVDFEDRKVAIGILREMLPQHDVVQIANRNCFHLKTLITYLIKLFSLSGKHHDINKAVNEWSKFVDSRELETIDDFFNQPEVDELLKGFDECDLQEVFRTFENNIVAISAHAGGVVLSERQNSTIPYSPLLGNEISEFVTSYCESMNFTELEQLGYIKFDMLGLSNLRTIHAAVKSIIENHKDDYKTQKQLLNELSPIYNKFDDESVYVNFGEAYTDGIFQFGSDGMKDLLQKLHPDSIIDLAIANALHRPGPLNAGFHTTIIGIKNHGLDDKFIDDDIIWDLIKDVVKETYTLPVFEEQVMQIGQRIAGYDGGELNKFRKFLKGGKHLRIRDPKEHKKQSKLFYDKFINGGVVIHGIDKHQLEKLWEMLEGFSEYSFNKSHALSYAILAYQSMWLATYYPGEWYASILTHAPGDITLQRIMSTLRKRKLTISIAPPRVNNVYIGYRFDADKNIIFIGIDKVKGIGPKAAEELLKITDKITSFKQFYANKQYSKRVVNKKVVLNLISIGFFDDVVEEDDRSIVVAEFKRQYEKGYKQKSFEDILDEVRDEYDNMYFYKAEQNAFGVSFFDHPLNYLDGVIKELQDSAGGQLVAACLIRSVERKKTKKEKPYLYIKIDSPHVMGEGVFVWRRVDELEKHLHEGATVILYLEQGWKPEFYNLLNLVDLSSGSPKVI